MNSRDLITINLNSNGGQKVVGDLNRISAAMSNLRQDNEKLRDSINKKRGEIEKTQKEINGYTSSIDKQRKVIVGAVEANKSLRSKMAELESSTKKGSPEWQRLNDKINNNNTLVSQNLDKVNQLSASHSNAQKRLNTLSLENDRLQTTMKANRTSITQTSSELNKYDKQINSVNKSTQGLTQKNADLTAKIVSLEKAGKSGSAQWNNATAQLTKNNAAISTNNIEIQRLTASRGDAQLRLSNLRAEEDRIRQSFAQNKTTISGVTKEIKGYDKDILNLNKTSANLTSKNKELQASLTTLENTNKRNSPEWQKLNSQISENVSRMTAARTEMNRLSASQTDARKRLGDLQTENKGYQNQLRLNNQALKDNQRAYTQTAATLQTSMLSYNQLAKRQSELRRELNNTAKSLFPEKWGSLNKQLIDVEKQMTKVSAGSQGVSSKFSNLGQTVTKVLALMGAYAAVRFFQDLAMSAVNFIKEGMQLAAVAEGIRNAFNRLNQPDLLANLRAETKGLVSDFALMQAAVKADKFNIPVEKLGSLLKFAQQRAQETGDSIDYLVTSIVNGIGRKSSLILDNLGISATRLQEEVGKAGNFTKGVINIVNEELEKQGDLALTSSEKAQQSAAKWQNAQLKVGTSLKWLKDRFSEMSGAAADAISSWLDTPLSEQLKKDQNEMNRLVSILDNHNISQETRNRIIKEINAKYPELLKYMSLEVDGLDAIKTKLMQVNKEYDNKIRLSLIDEKQLKPIREERTKLWEDERDALDHLNDMASNYGKNYGQGWGSRGKPLSSEFIQSLKDGTVAAKDWSEIEATLGQRRTATKGGDTQYSANIAAVYKHIEALKKLPKQLEANSKEEAVVLEKMAPLYKEQDQLLEQEKVTREGLLGKRRTELALALTSIAVTDQEKEAKEKNVKQLKSWVSQLEKQVKIDKGLTDANESLIKTQEDLLAQAKQMPESSEAEVKAKNIHVKSIEDEIKRLKELGVEKEKGGGSSDKYISKQRKEMNTHLLNLENNYKKQLNELKTLKSEQRLTEDQYNESVIETDKKYYHDRMSYLNEFLKKVQTNTVKSSSTLTAIGKQMTEQFGNGNVDLLSRPLVDAAKLVEKGWSEVGEGIATVFSSQYGITDNMGNEVEILVTPILPNGDVLSQAELEDYVDNVLQGADDLLSADSKGLVISVDVDPDGKAGDNLHRLQEKYYDLKQSLSTKPDNKLSEDITKDIVETNTKLIEVTDTLDKSRLSSLEKTRDKSLKILEAGKNGQIRNLEDLVLSDEEYAARLEAIELTSSQLRISVLKQYGEDLAKTEITNGELKENAIIESNDAIIQSEITAIQQRKDLERKARETNKSTRDQYGISTVTERMAEEMRIQESFYKAGLISKDTYEKALLAIELKYDQEKFQIREQYAITSYGERFDAENVILEQQREEGLLSEEEYQKALSQLKLKYAIEAAQNVMTIVGHASDAVSALQQAETDNLDAEYDGRIAAAQGNAAEVERLENEKAQKKLDIEKKYADVQFAVKASEIIGNTAVAIMQGYAQLGPIGGSIAAVFLGITGAAQLASANAERQKVKNMTLKGTNSSASNGERFMLPGKEEGGDIDVTRSQDGKNFSASYQPDKRGYVSKPTVIVGEGSAGRSKEWVASNGAVSNPTIRPIIDLIDYEQRKGTVRTVDMNHRIRQRMAGFETGGFMSAVSSQQSTVNSQPVIIDRGVDPVMIEMYQFLKQLKADGIPAIVGVDAIDAQQKYSNSITQNYMRP